MYDIVEGLKILYGNNAYISEFSENKKEVIAYIFFETERIALLNIKRYFYDNLKISLSNEKSANCVSIELDELYADPLEYGIIQKAESKEEKNRAEEVLDKISTLEGAYEFKDYCRDLHQKARKNKLGV